MSKLLIGIIVALGLFVIDRVLLAMEAREWINYRRRGLNPYAARYHMMELHAMMEPGMEQVIRSQYGERKNEDESGDPPGDPPGEETTDGGEEMRMR